MSAPATERIDVLVRPLGNKIFQAVLKSGDHVLAVCKHQHRDTPHRPGEFYAKRCGLDMLSRLLKFTNLVRQCTVVIGRPLTGRPS